jgi:hypothetical protein
VESGHPVFSNLGGADTGGWRSRFHESRFVKQVIPGD